MLSIEGQGATLCDGITRRELLRIGGLHLGGLTLAGLLRAQASAKNVEPPDPLFGRAKSVIVLHLSGGPSQYETFDPKPDAPAEIRGIFKPISTNVPGIQVCELLPRIAATADKLAIVRSMATNDPNHESGGYWTMTGHKYTGPNMRKINPTDWPSLGSMVKILSPGTAAFRAVMLPEPIIANPHILMPGQFAGFMGSRWDPDLFRCDPNTPNFKIEGLALPGDMPTLRLSARKDLLEQLNKCSRLAEQAGVVKGHDQFTEQALDVLLSGEARRAFALEQERPEVRDRYGRAKWGQSVLLARRLIEAGVRMVFVNWPREPGDFSANNPLWDTHAQNNARMKDVMCPQFDLGFSALIEDLEQRGLLAETLVVAIGEMGRTPKFNPAGGRDHWGNVFSFAMAGGGISGARTFGSSDRNGSYPTSDRIEPQDLTATILHLLGIGHEATFRDRNGRPMRATEGTPLYSLLGTQPATTERVKPGGVIAPIAVFSTDPLVNVDFADASGLTLVSPGMRGWQAVPLFDAARGDELCVRLVESAAGGSPKASHHVALGCGLASGKASGKIPEGARAALLQEIYNPRPGRFTFTVRASGGGSDRNFYRDKFLKNFTCRLVIFGYRDGMKSFAGIQEFAASPFEPSFSDRATGIAAENAPLFSVSAVLNSQQDGANQLDHGVGVAVILEKTSPGIWDLKGQPGGQGYVRVDHVELRFEPS